MEPGIATKHLGHALLALRIKGATPAQVAIQVTSINEIGQRQLIDCRDTGAKVRHLAENGPQGRWYYQPRKTQTRAEGLAGGAGIDDSVRIETLDRTDRAPVVAKLAVIVIFDDPRFSVLRPRHQLGPALWGHRHPEGKLMTGGDQHRADVEGVEVLNAEASLVNGNRNEVDANEGKDISQDEQARIFDGDACYPYGPKRFSQESERRGDATEHPDPSTLR